MSLRAAILLVSLVAGVALGAAASAGLVATAPAGSRGAPLKYYDPLP